MSVRLLEIIVHIGKTGSVNYDDALRNSHLRRCEAAAVRLGDGVPEVADQGLDFLFFREVNRFGLLPEHGLTVKVNR